MIIDTHCHLASKQFKGDLDEVIERAERDKISKLISIGTDLEDSKECVRIANNHDSVYATVGIHPCSVTDISEENWLQIISDLAIKSNSDSGPALLFGKNDNKNVLIVAISADRGLCGGFNGSIIKHTKNLAHTLKNDGKNFKFLFVGKKAYQSLRRIYKDLIIDLVSDFANPRIEFEVASSIRNQVLKLF